MQKLYPQGLADAFGDMLSLVKNNRAGRKSPCPRRFTYGKCLSKGCKESHGFEKEPATVQGRRFLDWVTKKCADIKANPKD